MPKPDIVEVARRFARLEVSGDQYKACCPLHSENTPSFYVHPGEQVFHCFGCGKGGDVYTLLSLKQGKPRSSYVSTETTPDSLDSFRESLAQAGQPVPSVSFGMRKHLFDSARDMIRRYFTDAQKYIEDRFGTRYGKLRGNVVALDEWEQLQELETLYQYQINEIEKKSRVGPPLEMLLDVVSVVVKKAQTDAAESRTILQGVV